MRRVISRLIQPANNFNREITNLRTVNMQKAKMEKQVYRVDVAGEVTQISRGHADHVRSLSRGRQGGIFYIKEIIAGRQVESVILVSDSKSDVESIPMFRCWEQWKRANRIVPGMRVYVMPTASAPDRSPNDQTGGYFFTAAGEMYSTDHISECWPSWVRSGICTNIVR